MSPDGSSAARSAGVSSKEDWFLESSVTKKYALLELGSGWIRVINRLLKHDDEIFAISSIDAGDAFDSGK